MAKHTFTTEDGLVYPWEGPVNYYCRGQREPDLRSKVYVDYFNMNEPEDRDRFSQIMTKVRNNSLQAVNDPVHTTDQEGHIRIMLIYERQFACDPEYETEEAVEVKVDEGQVEEPGQNTEEKPSEENNQPDQEVEVDEEEKSLSDMPSDSLNSQPIPNSEETKESNEDQEYESS